MEKATLPVRNPVVVERKDLQSLFDALHKENYRIVGPTLGEGAIVYDELTGAEDLPKGWTDEQDGGLYRLKRRGDEALFGYTVGPHSWKKYLFPPRHRLWKAESDGKELQFAEEPLPEERFAFFGVRACELHAIAIQDKVFLQGDAVDPVYRARRENAFLVAVNCGQAGGTCFCVSMNTGPRAESGYDLVMTEVLETGRHYFVVEAGTERGAEIMGQIAHHPATEKETDAVDAATAETAAQMGREMNTDGIQSLLQAGFEHPRWDEVAERCLTCANCTLACPTCFCSTVEDVTDLTGEHAERWRRWDSCFTMDFTYMNQSHMRSTAKSRYRQWMTHKLSTWHDQFDSSGCVGCGRCITWCPVGIDITEEVRAIRDHPVDAAGSRVNEGEKHGKS
ncbi:MAG: 4Fe-4S dicluster domain-containing protein [Nitrospinaceae bacterium]